MDSFYYALPKTANLNTLFSDSHYHKIPDDWCIVVADIRGSTAAIEQGRYQDVNFIGAAVISAFRTHVSADLPYCFGGDGAALLIKQEMLRQSEKILKSLCYWSIISFDLELHAGIIPVSAIRARGAEVAIALYQLNDNLSQTMFKGGGLSLAETMIKDDPDLRVPPMRIMDQAEVFSGLTCRWRPIPASKGVTISMLIDPLTEDNSVLKVIVSELESILGGAVIYLTP